MHATVRLAETSGQKSSGFSGKDRFPAAAYSSLEPEVDSVGGSRRLFLFADEAQEFSKRHPRTQRRNLMKFRVFSAAIAAVLSVGMMAPQASAMDGREKAALGAIALLGIAALAHNQNHYHEGQEPQGAEQTAQFERGYRDGLHNEPYDSRHSSVSYGQGYDAGQKERSNRLAHKNQNGSGTRVPAAAMRSCVAEVASSLGAQEHDVHAIKAGQEVLTIST